MIQSSQVSSLNPEYFIKPNYDNNHKLLCFELCVCKSLLSSIKENDFISEPNVYNFLSWYIYNLMISKTLWTIKCGKWKIIIEYSIWYVTEPEANNFYEIIFKNDINLKILQQYEWSKIHKLKISMWWKIIKNT